MCIGQYPVILISPPVSKVGNQSTFSIRIFVVRQRPFPHRNKQQKNTRRGAAQRLSQPRPFLPHSSLRVDLQLVSLLACKSVRLNSENFLRIEHDRLSAMIPDQASTGQHPRERGIISGFQIASQHCFLTLQAPDFVPEIANGCSLAVNSFFSCSFS
jgi:hypothetical protein